MRVRDYMTGPAVTIPKDADYAGAFEIMKERDLHHLPVIDGDEVVGLVTRRDLQLAARYYREMPTEISEVMHTPVVTISPDAHLANAVDQMMELGIGCLPVADDGGHLLGIITETDLLRALRELLGSA